jgi:cytidyltransferase-like protein
MIGKFNPIHKGHIKTIQKMLNHHQDSLILIGSCNSHIYDNSKYWFSYDERYEFIEVAIKSHVNQPKIAPLPDMNNINMWYKTLWDIIKLWKYDANEKNVKFWAGSKEDVKYFKNFDVQYEIVDRTENGISSTKVRHFLAESNSITDLIDNKKVEELIKKYYPSKQELFFYISKIMMEKNSNLFQENKVCELLSPYPIKVIDCKKEDFFYEDDKVQVKIIIKENDSSTYKTIFDFLPWVEENQFPHLWSYTDGNNSCDCNRHILFKNDLEASIPCGESNYLIRILNAKNNEIIYGEF